MDISWTRVAATHAAATWISRGDLRLRYSPDERKKRLERFHEKRGRRVWTRKVKYDVRKNFADTRMRVKGRFVKREDEDLLRDLSSTV